MAEVFQGLVPTPGSVADLVALAPSLPEERQYRQHRAVVVLAVGGLRTDSCKGEKLANCEK